MTAEDRRLAETQARTAHWRRWGPYLSERQWGTVREDYSPHGTAWDYFPHDHARSRAYRWGEDGLLGISDNHQRLCFALALWNEKDPILKERLFGLTGSEGNHGEDVKDYYFYLDSTPTHAYMKGLYKYPQAEFPYGQLVEENRRRGRRDPEFELVDTGIFEEDRYFDVVAEYAKATPDDLLIRITVTNRGPDPAPLHLLPTLWCRNTWSWEAGATRPRLRRAPEASGASCVLVEHPDLGGSYRLYADGAPEWFFTENDTNRRPSMGSRTSPRSSRTPSTRLSCVGSRPPSTRPRRAQRRPSATGYCSVRARARSCGCASRMASFEARPSGNASTRWSPSASWRPTSSTRR
jgi:hypothetical protein